MNTKLIDSRPTSFLDFNGYQTINAFNNRGKKKLLALMKNNKIKPDISKILKYS